MSTSDPIHVAFVWHMHQPYYRSARTGAFHMPWTRLHAVKDYLDMVEVLADYPNIHQTFNLVPSLVEQLEDYVSGGVADVYWQHTIKPAVELTQAERSFIVERMCERSDHPRAMSHPRYLELAQKRESEACRGWSTCAESFDADELRDLQIWFNLSWFDPILLESPTLAPLVRRGRGYREEDKQAIAEVQQDILARVIPAYRKAAGRGQIELSASPYFHPILPLLVNSDSARVGAGDTVLPRRRFAHPEDAWEQVARGVAKHELVFGDRPRGMWCSEQAVGEDVLPFLMRAGIEWTISDQTILSRSLSGSAPRGGAGSSGAAPGNAGRGVAEPHGAGPEDAGPHRARPEDAARCSPGPGGLSPYEPYLLRREEGEVAIIFRDHTLSDLIGFGYQSWDSRDAANDLLARIRAIGTTLSAGRSRGGASGGGVEAAPVVDGIPLVTIALDGENAWEYYPRDGRDFLRYLYEGLAADPNLRCVTVSEHLDQHPPVRTLDWLHTGSWIGGDLRTWIGDPGHNAAWELLHDARDLAASHRASAGAGGYQPAAGDKPGAEASGRQAGPLQASNRRAGLRQPQATDASAPPDRGESAKPQEAAEAAWRHILACEGSDWFWWFGEHHHTDLDHAWDLEFREHLREVYRLLGEPAPISLYLPVLTTASVSRPGLRPGPVQPVIDGRLRDEDGWEGAELLLPDHPSTMQRADGSRIVEARFAWGPEHLYLLLIPRDQTDLLELELELRVTLARNEDESILRIALAEGGRVEANCSGCERLAGTATGAWGDVVEIALPLAAPIRAGGDRLGLVLRVGRGGMTEHVFRPAGAAPVTPAG